MQGLGYNAYLKAVHEKLAATEALTVDTSNDDKSYDFFQVSSEKLKNKNLRPAEKVKILQQIEKLFDDKDANRKVNNTAKSSEQSKVVLTQEHFLESLKETKPSISASEKSKLQRVYTQFLTGRDGTMPDGSASNEVGGRTTLM